MKNAQIILRLLVISGLLLCTSGIVNATDKGDKSGEASSQAEMDEMMKKWQEAATPGENHKLLEQFIGSWETSSRMWMAGPDQPPSESKGTSEVKWILDGRFIMEEAKGEMLGQPFNGIGIVGYDNTKKRFVSSWVDNSGTALYTSEGSYNPEEKTFIAFGLMDDCSTGQHDKTVMYVNRIINRDRHVMEMHDPEIGGKNTKVGEIIYTRK